MLSLATFSYNLEAVSYALDYDILVSIYSIIYNIFSGYGSQYVEGVELEDVTDFISDYYAFKYVSRVSGVSKKDIARVLTEISNLLRNCEYYQINEVFLGTIRLKKVSGKNYWILVER